MHIYESAAILSGWSSSKVGLRSPILVLKSPQIMVLRCGCIWSSVFYIYSVASVSGMCRFFKDAVGGRYIFTTFILSLFGSLILANMLYSFPITCSTFSYFFMYMAIPPLVPFPLRFSIR